MAQDVGSRLPPPPREVPPRLRRALLANFDAMWGSAIFAAAGFLALPVGPIAASPFAVVALAATVALGALGLALTLRGLARGRRAIKLLRDGTLVPATIKACKVSYDRSGPWLPLDEFRRRWPEQVVRAQVERSLGLLRGAIGCFTLPFLLGTVLLSGALLFTLVTVVFLDWPADINGRLVTDKRESVPVLLALFAIVTLGGAAAVFGLHRWGRAVYTRAIERELGATLARRLPAGVPPPTKDARLEVRWMFEFRSPAGDLVEARDTAIFSGSLGDEPTEPVLFDPRRPGHAVLLDGLSVPARPSPSGAWQEVVGPGPVIRISALTLSHAFGAAAIGRAVWMVSR